MKMTTVTRRAAMCSGLALTGLSASAGGAGAGASGSGEALPRPATGPMELRVSTDTSIQNMPGWEKAARGYEQKYPGRRVNVEHINTGLTDKIITQHAA